MLKAPQFTNTTQPSSLVAEALQMDTAVVVESETICDELPWLQWEEFKRALKPLSQETSDATLQQMLEAIFGQSANEYKLWLSLATGDKDVFVVMIPPSEQNALSFLVYENEKLTHCLHSFCYQEGKLFGSIYKPDSFITLQELESIHALFKTALDRTQSLTPVNSEESFNPLDKKYVPSKPIQHRPTSKVKSQINWLEFEELHQQKESLKTIAYYDDRMTALKSSMTLDYDKLHKIWVTLDKSNKKHLLIATQRTNNFHSNTFAQTANIPERPTHDDQFDLVCFYETGVIAEKNILLQLRISKGGEFAELVYVKSGKKIKGNDLMHALDVLNEGLGIKTILLQDDAKIAIKGKKDKLRLRLLRPLTHTDNKTWYQRHGFEIYPCKNIPDEHFISSNHQDPDFSYQYTQDKETYKHSLNTLCTTSVQDLLKTKNESGRKVLKRLFDKYGPDHQTAGQTTLSNLLSHVFNSVCSKEKRVKEKANRRMARFYKKFLEYSPVEDRAKETVEIKFQKAVNVLQSYRLFVKKKVGVDSKPVHGFDHSGDKSFDLSVRASLIK